MKRPLAVAALVLVFARPALAGETFRLRDRTMSRSEAEAFLNGGDMPSLVEGQRYLDAHPASEAEAVMSALIEGRTVLAPKINAPGATDGERLMMSAGVGLIDSFRVYYAYLLQTRGTVPAASGTDDLQRRLDFVAPYLSEGPFSPGPRASECSAVYQHDFRVEEGGRNYAALFPNLRAYFSRRARPAPHAEVEATLKSIDALLEKALPGVSQDAGAKPQSLPQALCLTLKSYRDYLHQQNLEEGFRECVECKKHPNSVGAIEITPGGEVRQSNIPKRPDGRLDIDALVRSMEDALKR